VTVNLLRAVTSGTPADARSRSDRRTHAWRRASCGVWARWAGGRDRSADEVTTSVTEDCSRLARCPLLGCNVTDRRFLVRCYRNPKTICSSKKNSFALIFTNSETRAPVWEWVLISVAYWEISSFSGSRADIEISRTCSEYLSHLWERDLGESYEFCNAGS
jgi:hypothetical protein